MKDQFHRRWTPQWQCLQKALLTLFFLAACQVMAGTTNSITNIVSWTPLFKGIEYSSVRVWDPDPDELQAIICLRVDLTDPDVALFTTPKCSCAKETIKQSTSQFLETYGLQVAINGTFSEVTSAENPQPPSPAEVDALAISRGIVVSPQVMGSGDHPALAVLLFTSNNVPTYIATNWPATNESDFYTGIGGDSLLSDGVNVAGDDDSDDPRTALGISQDNRYLYLMTADGRTQDLGWARGITIFEEAEWLAYFGAYNGLNVDGGGSTTMSVSDCVGAAMRLNFPSFIPAQGWERWIGHHFGVYAKPLPSTIKDAAATPGITTAVIAWRADFDATSQVEYGLSTNYGSITPLDARMTKTHVVTLTGLEPGTNYYFRVISSDGTNEHSFACRTTTLSSIAYTRIFDITNIWRYTTNNLNGVNWTARAYDDSGWLGAGPGLLHVETSSGVMPRNTEMPPGVSASSSTIPRTYYFRSQFQFGGSTNGLSLIFSNYIDDGAVFYLNGAEIYRVRMQPSPAVITNLSTATARPCSGDATCPDVFTISGELLVTNLVQGTNVLAVEVHDQTRGDIVFGSALIKVAPAVTIPEIYIRMSDNIATLYWNGEGFTLQQSDDVSSDSWIDVPGPITSCPVVLTNTGSLFYRLRQ